MKKLGSDRNTWAQCIISLLINTLKKRDEQAVSRLSRSSNDVFQVLISTLLSHRTKDEVTWRVSSNLFSRYKTPEDFAKLSEQQIEDLIKGVGFYRVKAKRIKEISSILIEKWDAKVPSSISDLLSLPGVGRKTANCVLAYGFGIPAFPVDTHVHRISNRLGIVSTHTPEETEQALMQVVPQEYWGWLNIALVEFGKEICRPVKPRCEECELNVICSKKIKQSGEEQT